MSPQLIFRKIYSLPVVVLLFVCLQAETSCKVDPGQTQFTGYHTELKTEADFDVLKGLPISIKYAQTRSVKMVLNLADSAMYYLDAKRFPAHFDFCEAKLNYLKGLTSFNKTQYSDGPERKFALASLSRYPDLDSYILEIFAGDKMPASVLQLLYNQTLQTAPFLQNVKVLVSFPGMENAAQGLPTIYPEQIYAQQSLQSLNPGKTVGILRLHAEKNEDQAIFDPHEIAVLSYLPLAPGPVAGIITTVHQAPLSHLNVLAINRKIPNLTYTKAFSDSTFILLQNQWVFLEVKQDGWEFRPATEKEKANALKETTVQQIKLSLDPGKLEILPITEVSTKHTKRVGAKASHFGELAKIQALHPELFMIPEGGFAIPFSWYLDHLQRNGIDRQIEAFLIEKPINPTYALDSIRKSIKKAPINPALIQFVEMHIRATGAGTRFRFRSSTNAEDLPEFNGAGLYESATGSLDDPDKPIEKAIKKVWASCWSASAYSQREAAHIDHRTVAMGILSHRSFPEESANGVAVTRNLYSTTNPGFTINVQMGEVSVVMPPENVQCDELIYYTGAENAGFEATIDYLNSSSLTDKPVLSEPEIMQLGKALTEIHFRFKSI